MKNLTLVLMAAVCGLFVSFPPASQAEVVPNQKPELTSAVLITDAYGNPEIVAITGMFLDDCTQVVSSQVTQMDNTLLVQVFVESAPTFCSPATQPFKYMVELGSVPDGLSITVGLYNGTAAQQGVVEVYGSLIEIPGVVSQEKAPEGILVDITPATLNLKSKGRFITVSVDLPETYDSENMTLAAARIGSGIEAKKITFEDNSFTAKFNRDEVVDYLSGMDLSSSPIVEIGVELEFLGDTTTLTVEAKDTIKVIN